MVTVASTVPNLVSGVSQQPAPSRLVTSCSVMNNAVPSVVSGVMKRPPVEWKAQIVPDLDISDDASIYFVNRSATERYVLVIDNNDLELYNLAGDKQIVTFPDGKEYLPSNDANRATRYATVADTTFILNRNFVTTASDIAETTRKDPNKIASIFINRAVASARYSIYANGILVANFATSDNTTAQTALEGTNAIALGLVTSAKAKGYTDAKAQGSVITFSVLSTQKITLHDDYGGKAMTEYKDAIQSFSKLPPSETNGRLVKIQGEISDNGTSYWVEFKDGVWSETVGYGAKRKLDGETLPHVLVKTGEGTFEFREHEWTERSVGDAETNPDPSFIGRKINALFLHRGRLGLLAEENVILSGVSILEDFYLTTAVQILDTDPIDVASSTGQLSPLNHAVTFSKQLVLFSDKRQFFVTSGNVFSPKTVGINPGSAYPCSAMVQPVVIGTSAYFVSEGGTNTSTRELFFDADGETIIGEDVSIQVPSYIPNKVRNLIGSEQAEVLLVLSSDDQKSLYVNSQYTAQRKKVQSAWGKWTFAHKILGAAFFDHNLYFAFRVGNKITIEKTSVGPVIQEELLLDNYVTDETLHTFEYNEFSDTTALIMTTPHHGHFRWFRTDESSGEEYTVDRYSDQTYHIKGDVTDHSIVGGVDYEFRFEYSTVYLREEGTSGEAAIQDGRLQLRHFSQIYTDSSYFETHVTPSNGETAVNVFNGRILANADNKTDIIPRDTGEFHFPIFAKNEEVVIELVNDQPFRCAFGSLEWTAAHTPKAVRGA